jgi:hypothetical protein
LRRDDCAALGGERFPAAQAGRSAADCGRYNSVVLAFHGGLVDLRIRIVGLCAMSPSAAKAERVIQKESFFAYVGHRKEWMARWRG